MEQSYTKKYLKIYAAEIISILLGIISLFVVVPFISEQKEIYGVYSICVSTLVFLSYADLGFLSASTKFAAEYYSLNDKFNETRVISFGGFILFSVSLLISIAYLYLSFHPEILINGILESPHLATSKRLFLWMAIFAPLSTMSRIVQCIYIVRIESYIFQFINIIGSLLKILSVFVFFTNGRYEIELYFIFIQAVPIICAIIALFIARGRYDYDLGLLIRSFKWDKECFGITKDLALSGLVMMVSWMLYYELDQVVIARMYGPNEVAIFAVAFAILNYIRMFLGGLFSPYTSRFAHFRASDTLENLSSFYNNVVSITSPIVLCPIIALFFLDKQFIVAWAGNNYSDATSLSMIFVLINIFASLSYTSSSIITVFEKTYVIKWMAAVMPIIYWVGVFILPRSLSITSFGIMKLLVLWLQVLIYVIVAFRILKINGKSFLLESLKINSLPVLAVVILSFFTSRYFVVAGKGINNLMMVCGIILLITSVGYSISYYVNPAVHSYCLRLKNNFSKRTS